MHLSAIVDSRRPFRSRCLILCERKLAFFLVTGLFFLWTIPNNLNDVFILAFQLTKSMAVSMCVPLICYAVVAGYAFWGIAFRSFYKTHESSAKRGSE
jgi:fucose permease